MAWGTQGWLAVAVVLAAAAYLLGRGARAFLGNRSGACGKCSPAAAGRNLGRKVPLVQLQLEQPVDHEPRSGIDP